MPRKQGHERAHGPYQHGNRWRVVIVAADGARGFAQESSDGPSSFETFEAAQAYIEAFRAVTSTRSIGDAVEAFLAHEREFKGTVAATTERDRFRLAALLRLADGDRQLTSLTAKAGRELVTRRRNAEVAKGKPIARETVRGELKCAERFAGWCVRQGWLTINPFTGIELPRPADGKTRGKPQLRVDEARTFIAHLVADQSPEATAVLMSIAMGLRAHEVVERTVRDLDDDGRLLVVGKSKTKAGERVLAIPELVRERLRALTKGKLPTELIFSSPSNPRRATKCSRHWLHYWTVEFAKAAGVPRVTPHGLRGTFATMAIAAHLPGYANDAKLTVKELAPMLGHTSSEVTRRHYIAPGAEQSAEIDAVETLLRHETNAADANDRTQMTDQTESNWN